MAIGSTDTDEMADSHPAVVDQLEMTKTQSYMSDHRFNGEIGTPSKLEEKEQIHIEELQVKQEEIEMLTEQLAKEKEKLNSQGYLITYSSSAAVRKTLRNLGLEIFTIKPRYNRTFWSQGTVAISKFDKNKLKSNSNFEKLSLMEEEHLLTKASIPYRDQDLNSSKDDIINRRLDEQLFSNLLSTNKWREKWGMTKLSIKS